MLLLRHILIVLACLFFTGNSLAQVTAPVPHKRIDRAGGTTPAASLPNLQIPAQIDETSASARPVLDQPVSLSAQIQDGGAIIPNGLIWRVFDTKTDESGQLPMLFRSEEPTASLTLPTGEYVVHVSYGRAQSSDTLLVEVGPNIKSVILQAGALRLRAAVTTEINIPPTQLKFDIFADGPDGDDIPVATDVTQNTMVHLNSGTYKVISRWGEQNALVRADIRVEPGEVTEATLFHKASQVTFSLVSKEGAEAIADVDWKVQDAEGETLYNHLGAFPSTVLAEGDYDIFAQVGDTVYNRQIQVRPGRPLHFELLTTVY